MTKSASFQPTLFEFLEQLADNNNRPRFGRVTRLSVRGVADVKRCGDRK